jgi:O-acetyl-ADP-ribose deacetylase (regulator of RNase III)
MKNPKIKALKGDITTLQVDAIVNAANQYLLGGGGVDGAIHFAAGPRLKEECRTLGGAKTGEAKITKGYDLPAKYVIHTVGPIYGQEGGRERELLTSCYIESLKLAQKHGLRRIAFPAISTGVFHYPKKEAAQIAIGTAEYFLEKYPEDFDEIIFVLFDEENYRVYLREIV